MEVGWEIEQAEGPDLPILDGRQTVGALQRLSRGRRGFALVTLASQDDQFALRGGEIPCLLRGVSKEEPAEDAEADGRDAFDDEQPVCRL